MALGRNSKIKDLMENPQAVEIIEKYLPGISTNASTKAAYGMSLSAFTKFPQSKCPKDKAEEVGERSQFCRKP